MGGKERFWRKEKMASEERELRGLRVLSRKGGDEDKCSENGVGKKGSAGGEIKRVAVIAFLLKDTVHEISTPWSLVSPLKAHPEPLSLLHKDWHKKEESVHTRYG